MQFQPGMLVRLRSGGPLMTVEGQSGSGEIICVWFNDKNEPQRRTFPAAVLESDDD